MGEKGSVGWPSPGFGSRTSGVRRHAISARPEMLLIVIARCCSNTSSGVTPICNPITPLTEECLLVPFYVGDRAVGTLSAIMHTRRRKFEGEDERLMVALGQFASIAYQTQASIDDFRVQISARQQAEDALQKVEQQARSILDSALDAVVAMNTDGIITGWNKRAEEIFGWTRSEALGRRMSETIIPMKYRSSHETGLRRFFETGQGSIVNRRIEITALRRDGSEFPVELTVTPLESGHTWSFSAFIRDISDRKFSEEQLRASELNLRRMTETIPEMLWSATPEGAVDYCNARVLDYTGLSHDEIKGAGWMKMIHPDDADNMARVWARSVESGDAFQFVFRCLRASDNTYRWCVSSALPLRAADGAVLKWYGTVVDFHDWRQTQEDLRNTQAELAHVNRVMTMGELTASIAHEVTQPLAAIIASGDSCTAWLASQPPNLEKARAAAGRMIQAGNTSQRDCAACTGPVQENAISRHVSGHERAYRRNDLFCTPRGATEECFTARRS